MPLIALITCITTPTARPNAKTPYSNYIAYSTTLPEPQVSGGSDVPRPSVVVSGRPVRLYARSVAQKLRSTVTNANLPAPHTQPTEPPNSHSRRNVLLQERESDASCRFTRDGYVAVDRAMQKHIRGALKEPESPNRAAFTKAVL
ncbi:hypothetical protein AOLI_G00209790 [Acnodon oligacanthus]